MAAMTGRYLCSVNDEDGCGEVLHFWAQLQPNGKHQAAAYMERPAGVFLESEEMGDTDDDGEWVTYEGDIDGCWGIIGGFYSGMYSDPRFAGTEISND